MTLSPGSFNKALDDIFTDETTNDMFKNTKLGGLNYI